MGTLHARSAIAVSSNIQLTPNYASPKIPATNARVKIPAKKRKIPVDQSDSAAPCVYAQERCSLEFSYTSFPVLNAVRACVLGKADGPYSVTHEIKAYRYDIVVIEDPSQIKTVTVVLRLRFTLLF